MIFPLYLFRLWLVSFKCEVDWNIYFSLNAPATFEIVVKDTESFEKTLIRTMGVINESEEWSSQ